MIKYKNNFYSVCSVSQHAQIGAPWKGLNETEPSLILFSFFSWNRYNVKNLLLKLLLAVVLLNSKYNKCLNMKRNFEQQTYQVVILNNYTAQSP